MDSVLALSAVRWTTGRAAGL